MTIMIAHRLRDLRVAAGCSCREVDRLAGLTPGHVWALEHAKRDSKVEVGTLTALVEVLGGTVGYLAVGEGRRPSDAEVRRAVKQARDRYVAPYAQQ